MQMQRSLSEIATTVAWEPGFEIPEADIASALLEAGFDPSDAKERSRFQTLVRAARERRMSEHLESVEDFVEQAREHLGEGASDWQVFGCAAELQAQKAAEREFQSRY